MDQNGQRTTSGEQAGKSTSDAEKSATAQQEANATGANNNEQGQASFATGSTTGGEFIRRIDIPSTRAYVISIMDRYRQLKNANR
jgi:hypothetical protein